jgi:hypothetical protein
MSLLPGMILVDTVAQNKRTLPYSKCRRAARSKPVAGISCRTGQRDGQFDDQWERQRKQRWGPRVGIKVLPGGFTTS